MAAALGKETGPAGEGAILAGRKPDLGLPQDELQQAVIQFAGQLGQGTFLAQAQIAQQHAQYAINADEQRRPERQAGVVIEHQREAEDAAQDRIDTGGGCQGLDLGDGHDAGRQVAGGIALEKAHRQAQHPVHRDRGPGECPRHRHQVLEGMITGGLGGDSARLQTVVFVDIGQTQIQIGGLEQEPVQGPL